MALKKYHTINFANLLKCLLFSEQLRTLNLLSVFLNCHCLLSQFVDSKSAQMRAEKHRQEMYVKHTVIDLFHLANNN